MEIKTVGNSHTKEIKLKFTKLQQRYSETGVDNQKKKKKVYFLHWCVSVKSPKEVKKFLKKVWQIGK